MTTMAEPLARYPDHVLDAVRAALPQGDSYELPSEWHLALAEQEQRKESPSSIRNYVECPLKWFLERYSPIPDSDEVSFPSLVGTFVHRVAEVFYSEPQHLRTEELLHLTFQTAWDVLKSGNLAEGIVTEEIIEEFQRLELQDPNPDSMRGKFYNKARAAIENIPEFDGDPSEVRVVATEMWVRWMVKDVLIRGKIDRTLRAADGGVILDDWKTGRAYVENPDVIANPVFIPVGLYSWLYTKMTEDDLTPANVRAVRLLYIAHLKRVSVKITPEVLQKVELLVEGVVDQMNEVVATGRIIATPAAEMDEGQCKWCPASEICPAWTDGTFDGIRQYYDI